METFLSRHARVVIGTLSGFDRLVFRGTLRRLAVRAGMRAYLWANQVLFKDFGEHALELSGQLKRASESLAEKSGRPLRYLASSATSKEEIARKIAAADGIERGLICILTAVEPCLSYQIVRNRDTKHLELRPAHRKCLHIYHYHMDPTFGFMHTRIQTWFPFGIQVCLNGREWLARQMTKAGMGFVQRDNCFTWLSSAKRAQRLMDCQLKTAWPELLESFARRLNPLHETMFVRFPIDYYWSAYQSEWASDILFRDPSSLAQIYPALVHHGLTTFLSGDVLRFLGSKTTARGHMPPNLKAPVTSDLKTRPEGVRVKHRLGDNSIKMYDKQQSVLRIETTINDASRFKAFRKPEGKPRAAEKWLLMRKGVADLHRRAEVSQAANDRYLDALASVENTTSLGTLAARLCRPLTRDGRRVRALNPFAPDDAALFEAISHGEFTINGFRNRDLRSILFDDAAAAPDTRRRHGAAVSRKLGLLRAHGLIRKVPKTHRYHLTQDGRAIVTALLSARNASAESLTKLAA